MTQTVPVPLVSIRALQPVVAGLETLGYNTTPIFTKANISRSVLDNVDGGIPHTAMMNFWEEALQITGDKNLGLHLAEATPIDAFGVHTYATQSSPDLRAAYRRACRYQRLIHETTDLTFTEEVNTGILQHALPNGRSVPRQPAEYLVALWLRFGRLIAGNNWTPHAVYFAHETPSDTTAHQRIFQTAIYFLNGRTALHIPNLVLDTSNTNANQGLMSILDDYAERLLQQKPISAETTLSERVREQLLQSLTGGVPPAEEIAQLLHMSTRTLHRNLQKEGTTYTELLNQLRQEQAKCYLKNPEISISEVAFLLGFSEISSFYRAFKRWTGTTPAEFRANT